jgi:hypothetical protein
VILRWRHIIDEKILSLIEPDDSKHQKLLNLIIPEILGVSSDSNYITTWNYFNTYVKDKFSNYLHTDFSEKFHQKYEIKMSGKIVSISENILNYKTSGYIYQGGAHGYGFEQYYIFDLSVMKRMKFEDIFKIDSKSEIAKLLYEKDNKEHKLEDFEKNLGNIYMTKKGVGFFIITRIIKRIKMANA